MEWAGKVPESKDPAAMFRFTLPDQTFKIDRS
jgi:hypothetical protein